MSDTEQMFTIDAAENTLIKHCVGFLRKLSVVDCQKWLCLPCLHSGTKQNISTS